MIHRSNSSRNCSYLTRRKYLINRIGSGIRIELGPVPFVFVSNTRTALFHIRKLAIFHKFRNINVNVTYNVVIGSTSTNRLLSVRKWLIRVSKYDQLQWIAWRTDIDTLLSVTIYLRYPCSYHGSLVTADRLKNEKKVFYMEKNYTKYY